MPVQPTSDLDKVRAYFQNFGLRQAPEAGSPLYHALCLSVLDDPDMLQLSALTTIGQHPVCVRALPIAWWDSASFA